jgi:hypothetical protein
MEVDEWIRPEETIGMVATSSDRVAMVRESGSGDHGRQAVRVGGAVEGWRSGVFYSRRRFRTSPLSPPTGRRE